jgi:hypothetical protein
VSVGGGNWVVFNMMSTWYDEQMTKHGEPVDAGLSDRVPKPHNPILTEARRGSSPSCLEADASARQALRTLLGLSENEWASFSALDGTLHELFVT